jgi:prepilin-type N-terminal cleavage/methylation domain-containing protein
MLNQTYDWRQAISEQAIIYNVISRLSPGSRRERERRVMNIKMPRKAGFTLVEIMIVVATIGLLAAIAIPNFLRARNTAQQKACISNLHQIDGGKQQWAIENKRPASATPTADEVMLYIKNEKFPTCPGGGTYAVAAVDTDPTCSRSTDGHVLSAP